MSQELKKITRAIVKNYRPDKIILFGSRVWGKPKPWSDYDLFILKKKARKHLPHRTGDILRILINQGIRAPVDAIVFNQQEFQKIINRGGQLYRDILKRGEYVYEKY